MLCALSVTSWDQLHQEGTSSPFTSTFPGPSPSPVPVVEHPHLRAELAWVKPFLSSPKGAQHHQEGEAEAEAGAGVNRLGELCEPSSPGGPGVLHEQQILRGVPRTEVRGWGRVPPTQTLTGWERKPPSCHVSPLGRKQCPHAGSQALPGSELLSFCPWPHLGQSQQGDICCGYTNRASAQFLPSLVTF